MKYVLLIILLVTAAFAKEQLPDDLILKTLNHIEQQGMSKRFIFNTFNLVTNTVSASNDKGWEAAELIWNVQIADDIIVPYNVKLYRVDESFVVTESYLVEDSIAFLFPTKRLHDITNVISDIDDKVMSCVGNQQLTYRWTTEGDVLAVANGPTTGATFPSVTVNIETGETICSQESHQDTENLAVTQKPNFWQRLWSKIKSWFS